MKKNFYLIFFSLMWVSLIFVSCGKADPDCWSNRCGPHGMCYDGKCDCVDGVTGDKCDIIIRDLFKTSYNTNSQTCGGSYPVGTKLSCRTGNKINEVIVSFPETSPEFVITVSVDSNRNLTVAQQTSNGYDWSGSGVLSEDGKTLNLTITRSGAGQGNCTYTIDGTN